MADLHLSKVVTIPMIAHAVNLGLAQKPDLICVTGDFITGGDEVDAGEYGRTLSKLSAAAPTYAVLGNHDGGLWAAARGGHTDHSAVERVLQSAGIELLHNRGTHIEVQGQGVTLAGVGDLWSDEIQAAHALAAGTITADRSSYPSRDHVTLRSRTNAMWPG